MHGSESLLRRAAPVALVWVAIAVAAADEPVAPPGASPDAAKPVEQRFPRFFFEIEQRKAGGLGDHSMFDGPDKLATARDTFDTDYDRRAEAFETLSEENLGSPIRKYKMALARERLRHLPPQRVTDALRIEAGMEIADIGAGTGYFSFHLARALRGTGKVYATDLDPQMIDLLQQRCRAESVTNLVPVLVRPGELDPFYQGKEFDLIFLSSVFEFLPDPVTFFTELRACLRPGTGRLVLIHPTVLWDFQAEDFYNWAAIFDNLKSKGPDHPVCRRMPAELQAYLAAPEFGSSGDIPGPYREMFVEGLNGLLDDPRLVHQLLSYSEKSRALGVYAVATRLRQFSLTCRWIYHAQHRLFQPPYEIRTEEDRAAVRMMNKGLLIPLFVGAPFFEGHLFSRAIIFSDRGVIRKMEAAGYRLVQRHDFMNYFHFLEFAADVNRPQQASGRP